MSSGRRIAGVAAWLLLIAGLLAAAPAHARDPVAPLLDRASEQASQFRREFGEVVAAERYRQEFTVTGRPAQSRTLDSEMFFVTLNHEGDSVNVRRILQVDGIDVHHDDARYARALDAPRSQARRALLTLANEGARYNLGDLTRNFSDPTLAQLFVSRERRERFTFKVAGVETAGGRSLTRVTFSERSRPTLIREGRRGGDVPASGTLWVDADGHIWRTELRLAYGTVKASLRVTYQLDTGLGMMVPASMDEEYSFRSGLERRPARIVCHADYSNFRRFRTASRLVAPGPLSPPNPAAPPATAVPAPPAAP